MQAPVKSKIKQGQMEDSNKTTWVVHNKLDY